MKHDNQPPQNLLLNTSERQMLLQRIEKRYARNELVASVFAIVTVILFLLGGLYPRVKDKLDIPDQVPMDLIMKVAFYLLIATLVLGLVFLSRRDTWSARNIALREAFMMRREEGSEVEQWSTLRFDSKFITWIKAQPGLADVDMRGRRDTVGSPHDEHQVLEREQ